MDAARGQHAPHLPQRMVADVVEDEVVALLAAREVLLRVVDSVTGAERAHQLHVARARHARDLGALGARNLHRERADPARGAVHQYLLSRPQAALVAQALQGRDRGNRHRGRLLEAQVRRLVHQRPVLAHDQVLGERAPPRAEHRVPGLESGHARPDRGHRAGKIDAQAITLRPAEARLDAHEVGRAREVVPVKRVDGGGVHAHQHLAGGRHRPSNLGELEHVGRPVAGAHPGLHARPLAGRAGRRNTGRRAAQRDGQRHDPEREQHGETAEDSS